jgi:hypothetical protein
MKRKEEWDTYTGEESFNDPESEDWATYFGTEDW